MLGVSIHSVNGRPATFTDELFINGFEGAIAVILLNCLLLLILYIGRIEFRWWIVTILLLLIGTPVALYSGRKIADYLWTQNQGGIPWEGIAPQVIGLAVAWILYVPIAFWLTRYRSIVDGRNDLRANLCPSCTYNLTGNTTGTCPECGTPLDDAAGDEA